MTSYIVHVDFFEDKEHKKLALHHDYYYETQSCAEFAICSILFNHQLSPMHLVRWGHDFPEEYIPYINVYMTTKEYQTVEEEANADDYNN